VALETREYGALCLNIFNAKIITSEELLDIRVVSQSALKNSTESQGSAPEGCSPGFEF